MNVHFDSKIIGVLVKYNNNAPEYNKAVKIFKYEKFQKSEYFMRNLFYNFLV